ncbi:MAG TPA: serine hydrolase, partial [Polyangia bacterium]
MAPDYNSLSSIVLSAIDDRVIPGAVVAIGQGGRVSLLEAFGNRQVEPECAPATVETVYDLASLTKAVVTSLLVMKGVEEGRWHLDQPLGGHLKMLADRPKVTIRRVLSHSGGFPAHRKFYQGLLGETPPGTDSRALVVERAAAEPLVYEPGSRSLYSDLGFILLGAFIEQAMSERLDVLAERMVFHPLQLAGLGFVDLCKSAPRAQFRGHEVAPTERCPMRGRLIVGEVHDLNAFAMGGIAGHAGLFGGARELLEICFALSSAYHGRGVHGGAPLVAPEVLRAFWQPAGIPGSTWRLGWDGPSVSGSLAGAILSRRAVGHL